MKILEIVRHITRKITYLFGELLTANLNKHAKGKNSPLDKPKGRKSTKKRKSFHSFLKEHNSYLLTPSSKIRKKTGRNWMQLKADKPLITESMSFESSSNHENLEENITDEIPPHEELIFEVEPFFMDQDGIEISIIEQQQQKNDQLNNSIDSDTEILKFVFGEEGPPQRELESKKWLYEEVREGVRKGSDIGKEWWREALDYSRIHEQSSLDRRASMIRDETQSLRASGCESNSSRIRKPKTKRIRHRRPKSLKQGGIRVINILDLVDSEDHPKLFQIPLAMLQEA